MNSLDNLNVVEKLVAFHVDEHNEVMWHSAFRGQTPDEMYLGAAAHVADELGALRAEVRRKRLATNRALSCPSCEPETRMKTSSVQLRRADS